MRFLIIFIITALSLIFADFAKAKKLSEVEQGRSITCDDKKPKLVRVALGRVTVLNFPFKPKDVVPGNQAFDFKQIKNDLIIVATNGSGKTNAVVYLEDRRCSFNLVTVKSDGDDILTVKDPKDSQYEMRF